MTYEEALVEDRCCQSSPEDQMEQALNHYEGIAKVVMHWNSYIANAIKAYPRLTALEAEVAELRGLLGELIARPSLYTSDDYGMHTCKVCNKDYHIGYSDRIRRAIREQCNEYPMNLPLVPDDNRCTNPACPAVRTRAKLAAKPEVPHD